MTTTTTLSRILTHPEAVTINTTYGELPRGVELDSPSHGLFTVSRSRHNQYRGVVTLTYRDGVTTTRQVNDTVCIFDEVLPAAVVRGHPARNARAGRAGTRHDQQPGGGTARTDPPR